MYNILILHNICQIIAANVSLWKNFAYWFSKNVVKNV